MLDDLARYLAQGFGCDTIVALAAHAPGVRVVTAGGEPFRPGHARDPDSAPPSEVITRSIVACDARAGATVGSLRLLRELMTRAPAGVFAAHPNACESRPESLRRMLEQNGIGAPFTGWARDARGARVLLAVLENPATPSPAAPPAGFRVDAFMPAFNEADLLAHSVAYLAAQGIDVHVVDNWSTDGTWEIAQSLLGRGVTNLDRFPIDEPPATYDWRGILRHVESLALASTADWCMLHDVDERRFPARAGHDLRTALCHAEARGFNCVDHVVLEHPPVDDGFDPSRDVVAQFPHWTFSRHRGHFHQRKAWKHPGVPVSLESSAGHDVRFPGRRVDPFKLVLRHYPIRSQAHGERKVFGDRVRRWNSEERRLGWHRQYDAVDPARGFLRDSATLESADDAAFREGWLIERLSGLGVFDETPWWATGPREPFYAPAEDLSAPARIEDVEGQRAYG